MVVMRVVFDDNVYVGLSSLFGKIALQLNLVLITSLRLRNNKDGQFSKNQPVFKTVVTARVKISWFNN